jgi:pimeloyl-ACP methyl ester carboxylesterase
MPEVQERPAVPGQAFKEHHVDADGYHMRYMEAGEGEPLVCLHGAGGLRLSYAHDILSERFRVIVFEAPGFGTSPVNERSQNMTDLARSMNQAVARLNLGKYHLMGNSFGGRLALFMAVENQDNLASLVLVAPAAIRPETGSGPAPTERDRALLFAHPERQPALPPASPEVIAKQVALVSRLRGPARDAELEEKFADLHVPVLVMFGTEDRMIPSTMGHIYREKISNCNFVLVYDAGHAIDGDRPEAFSALVSDFLQRGEAFIVNRHSSILNP